MTLFNLGRACGGLASRSIEEAVLNVLGGASDMFARALAVVAKDVIRRPRRSA